MRRLLTIVVGAFLALGLAVTASAVATPRAQASGGTGGVVLDGFGGLHPFGSVSVNTSNAPYWPGWAIAKSLAMLPDGSGGWELDGKGGIHPFGRAGTAANAPYWANWDIARAVVMLPDGRRGYEMDGFAGIHPLGGAPALNGAPYWPGWDIARGLDIHVDRSGNPDGGWVLDGFGAIHQFGAAPAWANPHYYPGWDLQRRIHFVPGGAFVLNQNGIVSTVGSPSGVDWSGYPSWGTWDIAADMVPLNPALGSSTPTPDRAQLGGLMAGLHSLDRNQRGLGGLSANGPLTDIAGNGTQYNLAACGGSSVILDRSQDMYLRNYFAHPILGCAGSQLVFGTYMRGLGWSWAGENIAWLGGVRDPIDAVARINLMWLNSPEHFVNMMGSHYNRIGCGADYVANGSYQGFNGPVWVWACEFTG